MLNTPLYGTIHKLKYLIYLYQTLQLLVLKSTMYARSIEYSTPKLQTHYMYYMLPSPLTMYHFFLIITCVNCFKFDLS